MKNVLVTGANRGIGFEFVQQFLRKGFNVIATCRKPDNSDSLIKLKKEWGNNLHIVKMDVSSESSIIDASITVNELVKSLDILINNAGTYSNEQGLSTLKMEALKNVFTVNTFGPLLVAKYFTSFLKKGENPIIANLFSGVGFITNDDVAVNGQYSYGASKAALNICIKYMAADLKQDEISVIGIGPGFVLTDMTKDSEVCPPLLPEESVLNMISIIERKTIEDTGLFFENDGRRISVEVRY